jgi:hypothetical protein
MGAMFNGNVPKVQVQVQAERASPFRDFWQIAAQPTIHARVTCGLVYIGILLKIQAASLLTPPGMIPQYKLACLAFVSSFDNDALARVRLQV